MIDKNNARNNLIILLRILPILIIVAFTIFLFNYKDALTVEQILNYTPKNLALAIIFILIMYAIKSLSFVFPLSLLMIVSARLFSIPTAIIINIIGTAITISVPYLIGKFSGQEFTDKLVSKHKKLEFLDSVQKNNNFFFSYIARVIGILPCDVVSMYMGSVGISYWQYITGGVLGFLPRIIAFTMIGITITDPSSPAFIISCTFNILLAVFSIIIYKYILKKKSNNYEEQ